MKKLFENLSLSLFSAFLFFLFLEFIVFRFIFPATDLARTDFTEGIVRYQAGQKGVNRVKSEIKAPFRINSSGWNSKYEQYKVEKDPNTYRVAIIGDSYLAAFQVDYNKSVAEQLELKLGEKNVEVYRFGIDGAPMSQYLHMLRKEVLKYNPDLVIVNVVHNDFNESYAFKAGTYSSAFLKYKVDSEGIQELPPLEYKAPWYSWIREKSATWKYLAYRQQVRFGILRNLILGNDHDVEYRANIDISTVDQKNNLRVTDYTFNQMKQFCDRQDSELIIVMGGDDETIYESHRLGRNIKSAVLPLNKVAQQTASKYGIRFIDLHDHWKKDYALKQKRFSFINDAHWNEYTHSLVAGLLTKMIKNDIKPALLVH